MTKQFRTTAVSFASTLLTVALCASAQNAGMVDPRLPAAGPVDVATARHDFFTSHPATDLFERGDRITRVHGRAFSRGAGPSQSATAFIKEHADLFGVRASDLLPTGAFLDATHSVDVYWDEATQAFRFTLLGYSQVVNGVPVFRSSLKLLVRNEPGFPLVLAAADLRDLGAFQSTLPAASALANFDRAVWSSEVVQVGAAAQPTEAKLVIFAGADDLAAKPTLAVSFVVVRGTPGTAIYSKMLYVADATTGKVLFEEEQICNADISGTVKGLATTGWGADACANEVSTGLPYATITGGAATTYANVDGAFVVANAGTGSLNLTSNLAAAGRYFKVANSAGTSSTLSQTGASGGVVNFVHNAANTSEQERAQVNAYIHANIARDYIIAANPSYPTIAGQQAATAFQINVSVAGTCNAFYDGPSINFYSAGGGCNNTAFSTVVHHEYGHHMVAAGGSGQGAYGEGMGDVLGAVISENSSLGIGFQSCTTGIRNASNTCMYSSTGCSSCGSEIHACGQLLSGCAWNVRTNLQATDPVGFRALLRNLIVNSVLLHSGTTIASDITIDFLTLNDNNADLTDGTPNYPEINNAFTLHGLPGPTVSPIKFTIPSGIPQYASPSTTLPLAVQVSALGGTPQPNTGKLYWRVGTGAFTSVAMTQGTPNNYTAQLQIPACGSSINYYFEAATTTGALVKSPANAPTSFYSTAAGYGITTFYNDSLEVASAWVVGATGDAATTGIWTRVNPNGTGAQPEDDHTAAPGVNCYVTGQGTAGSTSLGEADIDGGATTLTSPTFNAPDSSAIVSYWRWYSNDTGGSPNADSMPVQISNNNGSTWVQLELVTENTNAWTQKSFRIADFVTPTSTMKVRFVPSDTGTGSVVEAGVDDFTVVGVSCTPPYGPADLNQDTFVNGGDLAILLSGWGTANGDVDHSGVTDGSDLALLLSAWTG